MSEDIKMKKNSKSEKSTKGAPKKKPRAISPIELHLIHAEERDRLHEQIDLINFKIAVLLQQRADLMADLV